MRPRKKRVDGIRPKRYRLQDSGGIEKAGRAYEVFYQEKSPADLSPQGNNSMKQKERELKEAIEASQHCLKQYIQSLEREVRDLKKNAIGSHDAFMAMHKTHMEYLKHIGLYGDYFAWKENQREGDDTE